MATYRYVVADVFTDKPLEGNQLAVFTDAREIPEERLQLPDQVVELGHAGRSYRRPRGALGDRLGYGRGCGEPGPAVRAGLHLFPSV